MQKLNIIFMGTPEFSVPALESVHEKYGVKAVVTVPDRPKGRGKKMLPSAIKSKALELGIPVLQPTSLKDPEFHEQLRSYDPDIMVVIAFRILPEAVYSMASKGAFNIHGSLLPRYRGAAPINWTIINGDTETGLTSFILAKKVDTGNMLMTTKIQIPELTTAGDLHDMLMPLAADMAVDTVEMIIEGKYSPLEQDETMATPAPKIFREDCRIDWEKETKTLINFIHGVSPVPCAWTEFGGKRMKIYRVEEADDFDAEPGTCCISCEDIMVKTGDGALKITQLQPPGKRTMDTCDYLCGYRGDNELSFD